jgi:hypothetical protein
MKNKLIPKKRDFIIASAALSNMLLTPTAYAYTSVQIVVLLINSILGVFFYAGIVLLVYSVVAFILAMKNEDAESKVQAISQISVSIVCMTLSGTIRGLMAAVGI